jgi:hypothetical protein
MKKFIVLLCAVAVSLPMFASDDKPIEVAQLPAKAKEFISTNFKDVKVALATVDKELFDRTYEVIFTDGSKVEFYKNGAWKEVDCRHGRVPAGISDEFNGYLETNYPDRYITEISRERGLFFEITLDNGLELKFAPQPDMSLRLVEIDD